MFILKKGHQPGAGIKRTDNSWFYTDLEFVRPIYFAKNVKKKRSENFPFFFFFLFRINLFTITNITY